MAKRHKLKSVVARISTFKKAILGTAPMGSWISCSQLRENITDEMIQQYIEEQEGEPIIDDSRFPIDPN